MRFNDESWTACVISSILSVSLPIPSSLFSNIKLTDERFFSHPRREPFFPDFAFRIAFVSLKIEEESMSCEKTSAS